MKIPAFLKQVGDSIIYNEEGELLYYLPDTYFTNTKSTIAMVVGQYVSTLGVFDWAIMDTHGKVGKAHPFKFPTVFMCRPSSIEKVKDLSLNGEAAMDYRVLHFKKGDEAVTDINVPKIIDNVEYFFSAMVKVENKMPPTIPYDKFQDYFVENMALNGKGYGLNMQMFGLMISELCRDPDDLSKPFRLSNKIDKGMTGYRQISIINVPKFISPYVSLTSQNWDESLMAAVEMSASGNNTTTPLERVVTG